MLLNNLFEALARTGQGKTAVVGWGRGMGHKGHMMLASSVITKAKEVGGDPYFVVSRTVGKDDPLTADEKLAIYKKVFPQQGHVFQAASDEIPNLTFVLTDLNKQGYDSVVVVVGADQVKAFQYLKNYNNKPDKSGNVAFKFKNLEVISRQETGDPSAGEEGPRATPMRAVLNDPSATPQQQFQVWRDAMSPEVSDEEVRDLMMKAKERMQALVKPKKGVAENYHSDLMKQTYAKFFKPAPPKTVLAVKKFLSDVIISLGTAQDNDYNDNDEEISWEQDLSDVREAYGKLRSNTSPNWFDIADSVLSYDTEFRESMLEWAEEELGSKLVDFLWDEVWEAKHKISRADGSYNIDVDSGQEVKPHNPYDPEKDPPKTQRNIEWKVMINGEQKIKFGGVSNNQEAAMKVALTWARSHGYEREVQAGKIKVVQVQQGLKEFAPGSGGGESGRWYTDDQMTDLVGDGWWEDMDVSGNISKQEMIEQAQAWLDDQGYSVHVLNCRLNDDDMDWFIEGNFHNPGFAKKGVNEFAMSGGDDEEDPFDNYPCYDCGSTIFLHHTELCELAEDNAIRDLPSKPRSQHWTGEVPKGLQPIPGLGEGVAEAELDEACWKDYKQIGMKKKGGKQVPNCVPKESMLPASAFAGTPKNKLGPSAHLKGSMKRPARAGDLVGSSESVETEAKIKGADGKACWKGYKYAGTKNGKDKCVPIGEAYETEMSKAIALLEGVGDKPSDPGAKEFVSNKFLVKFVPDALLIYKGGELIYKKLGDYSAPKRSDVSMAKSVTSWLWEKYRLNDTDDFPNKVLKPSDVHNIADKKGIPWDNNRKFLNLSKKLTGKSHLDKMSSDELRIVYNYIRKIR